MRMTMPTRRRPATDVETRATMRFGPDWISSVNGRHRHLLFLPETRAPAVGFKKDGYFGKLPTPALSGSGSRVSSQPRIAEHPCFNDLIETLPAWHLQIEIPGSTPESREEGTIGFEAQAHRGRRFSRRRRRGAGVPLRAHAVWQARLRPLPRSWGRLAGPGSPEMPGRAPSMYPGSAKQR